MDSASSLRLLEATERRREVVNSVAHIISFLHFRSRIRKNADHPI